MMKGEETLSEKDSIENNYIRQNRIFADAFNFFIYGGRQVIDPDSLEERNTQEILILHEHQTERTKSLKRTRDVIKLVKVMTNEKAAFMIFAVENQTHVHYAMPVRAIMYDSIQYVKQVEEIVSKREKSGSRHGLSADEFLSGFYKSDTILPVVTLVIYFGDKEWDGAMSLYDMFQTEDTDLLALVPNYKLNLLAPAHIKDEDFERFQTSLKEVLSFIKYSKDKQKLQELVEKDEGFRYVNRDAVEVINKFTGAKLKIKKDEEGVDMCLAIKELMADAAAKARAEAKAEAETEMCQALKELMADAAAKARVEGLEQGLEQGLEIATLKSIRILMETMSWSADDAMETLKLSEAEKLHYKDMILRS
jgi:hypothetical protein